MSNLRMLKITCKKMGGRAIEWRPLVCTSGSKQYITSYGVEVSMFIELPARISAAESAYFISIGSQQAKWENIMRSRAHREAALLLWQLAMLTGVK